MSEKINKSDIIEDKILSSFIKEAERAEKATRSFDESIKSLANSIKKELSKTESISIENIQKRNILEKKATKVLKDRQQSIKSLSTVEQERLKIQKSVEKAQAQKILADSKENKELQKLRAEKNKINKATRDEIKQAERNTNAYTKLSDASRRYKNESKTLGAELLALEQAGKKNSKVWNDTQKRYTQVTAKAKTTDAQLKKLDATVGDNQRSVGNYAKATRGLSRALGTLGIAVGVGQIFRNVGGIISNYNQAVTDLGAISGKSAEELKPLNEQARQLGATTQFSASEVTGLQIELAKLGFTTQEIMDSTGGIANFAAATGVEIPRAAALAGSALRAFGLDATEIDRVVSTLGVATTKSALDFAKLEQGLSTVAPVAASFGFSIEDTTALLGQLSNAGFDASSAATATRNILLNLADSGGDLAKQLGRPIKSADDLAAGLQELQARGIDLAEALELTDKRSVAAFSTFIEGSGDLVTLRDSITDVNSELKDMADKRLQSVSGALKLLSSAFEEQVLGFNEATGASDKFQASIKFVAENLGTIFSIMGKLVALMLINIARQKILNSGIIDYAKNLFTANKNQKGLNSSMNDGSKGAGKFGKALKSIGWAVLIGAAIELGKAFYDIASGAARARHESELFEKEQRRIGGANTALIDSLNKKTDERLKKLRQQRELELASAKTDSQRLAIKEKFLELENQIVDKAVGSLDKQNEKIRDQIKQEERRLLLNRKTVEAVEKASGGFFSADDLTQYSDILNTLGITIDSLGGTDVINNISESEARLKVLKETELALRNESSRLLETNEDLNHEYKVSTKNIKQTTDATEKLTGAREWGNEKNDEFLDQLDEYLDKRKKIREDQEEEMRRIESGEFEVGIGEAPLLPEDEVDEVTDQQKELYNTINTAQDNITKAYSDHVDRRIELAQKEIDSQKELRDILKAQAEAGNIDAQDSIKATIEAEREKEAEIIRLEKRKQQVQMISQGLQTYLNLLEGGEKPAAALAQTAITSQGLIALLSGLQGFWKGTDYAPEGLAWTQEKGAEIITDKKGNIKSLGSDGGSQLTYLEKGDKVKTASETTKFLNSFESLNNEQRIPKQDVAGNSYDIMLLGSKLDQVVRAVKSIPQSSSDFQTITKSLSVLTKTTNSGGDKQISKHYIKR